MKAIVPAKDGVPQIGNRKLYKGVSITSTQALAHFQGELEDGWQELTDHEYAIKYEEITGSPYMENINPQPTELEILNAKIDYIAMLVEPTEVV